MGACARRGTKSPLRQRPLASARFCSCPQNGRRRKEGGAMLRKEVLDQIPKYVHPFRITDGKGFQLKDFDPGDTRGLKLDKGEAAGLLQSGTAWLAEEQDMLYAQNRWSLLLVFQAMDAAG